MLKRVISLSAIGLLSLVLLRPTFAIDRDLGLDTTAKKAGLMTTAAKQGIQPLIGNVIGAGLAMIGVLFFIMTLYGGILWMTSHGNDETAKKGRDAIIAAAVGLIIVVAAYALTTFVFQSISGKTATGYLAKEPENARQAADTLKSALQRVEDAGGDVRVLLADFKSDQYAYDIVGKQTEALNTYAGITTLKDAVLQMCDAAGVAKRAADGIKEVMSGKNPEGEMAKALAAVNQVEDALTKAKEKHVYAKLLTDEVKKTVCEDAAFLPPYDPPKKPFEPCVEPTWVAQCATLN